ncbi:3'-5' exonuclease [Sediminicola luteus]|uniref:DNA polymerase III subunit epsilon n=1 Tax=Sediminicola luteus TaxID=319238 RepID=A0A2A4G5W0_9FLAO|nr:3'-5' exonuclease [Sediminicola luteus]PCE63811.1 DNA polymerase III subunit epsilon [Sediminicola luteus]
MSLRHWFKKDNTEYPEFWQHYAAGFGTKPTMAISDAEFVVFDTETTGFSFDKDRILSIGALKLQNGQIRVQQVLEVYLTQHHFDSESVPIHGLLHNGKKEQISEKEALKSFLEFIGNAVLVAHHAAFDMGMINTALAREGLPKLKNRVVDTSVLYRRTLLQSPLLLKQEQYSLDEIAQKFDISVKDRHTALGDAFITAMAFLKCIDRLKCTQLKELFKSGINGF